MINSDLTTLVLWLGAFFPGITDGLFSTQGIMVMLLVAYGGAMWMFLTSAPKVYTLMVSDLVVAQQFYEELLNLPVADLPLHYYYNYEQSLGSTMLDPIYTGGMASSNPMMGENKGLWFQLKKNTQLHIIGGASLGYKNSQRHVCFDHECLDDILLRVQSRRLKYKIRSENPLNFLVKDLDGRVIEMSEAKT